MDRFPELTTERLKLRKLNYHDIPKIIEYAGDSKIAVTTLNIPHPYAEEDAIFWLNMINQGFKDQTQYTFGIDIESTKEFIGAIGIMINKGFDLAEIGYWIAVPYWNKGYATEAAQCIIKFGFETLNLNKIIATHLVENPSSGRVMIKNKMIKEAELLAHTKKDNVYKDLIQYRLTRGEYDNSNKV